MESASLSDVQNDIADLASVELPPEVIAETATETAAESGSAEKVLVVINSSVADANEIVNDLGTDCEVLILEAGTDALDTINDYLDAHSDTEYSALHIVSHGNDGYITLNGEKISNDTLNPADWKAIGEHLTDDADILIYGCNTAKSDAGKALIQSIADLTGADVAASTDSTGANGNWDLEYQTALIESATLNPDHYQYSLAGGVTLSATDADGNTVTLDTTSFDTLDKAINAAKDTAYEYTITFTQDYYSTLMGGVITGSHTISTAGINITINGLVNDVDGDGVYDESDGDTRITLDGGAIFKSDGTWSSGGGRIFTLSGANMNITFSNLVLQNGYYGGHGGAVFISGANVELTVEKSLIQNSWSTGQGGGIGTNAADVTINIVGSTLQNNTSTANNGGGAIGSEKDYTTINISENSTFSNNHATGGGAISVVGTGSIVNVQDSTFSANTATGSGSSTISSGGAIKITGTTSTLNVSGSTFSSNTTNVTLGTDGKLAVSETFTDFQNAAAGGAIYFYSSDKGNLTIHSSTFTNNAAARGGAVAVFASTNGTATITDVTFENNTGIIGGAFSWWGQGSANISYSLFNGNTAAGTIADTETIGAGGAIYTCGKWSNSVWGYMLVANTTFINNTAETTGGAVAVAERLHFRMVNSTVVGNSLLTSTAMSEKVITSTKVNQYYVGGAGISLCKAYQLEGNNDPSNSTVHLLNNLFTDNTLNGGTANDLFGQSSGYSGYFVSKYNVYTAVKNVTMTADADENYQLTSATDVYDKNVGTVYKDGKWQVDANKLLQIKELTSGSDLYAGVNKTANFCTGLMRDGTNYGLTYTVDGINWLDIKGNSAVVVEMFNIDKTGYMRYGYYTAGAAQYKPVIAYTDTNTYSAIADLQTAMASGGTFTFAPVELNLNISTSLSNALTLNGHESGDTVLKGSYTFNGTQNVTINETQNVTINGTQNVTINGLTFSGTLTGTDATVFMTNGLITGAAEINSKNLVLANTSVLNNTGTLNASNILNLVSSSVYNGGTLSGATVNILNSIVYDTTITGTSTERFSLVNNADTDYTKVFGNAPVLSGLALVTLSETTAGTLHQNGVIAGYSGTNLYYSKDSNAANWFSFAGDTAVTGSSIVKLTEDAIGNWRMYSGGASMGAYSSAMESLKVDENGCITVTTSSDEVNPYDDVISLREAIQYFVDNSLDVATHKIVFSEDLVDAEGKITITLKGDLEAGYATCGFVITGGVVIDGGDFIEIKGEKVPRVTLKIDGSGPLRHFYVKDGDLRLYNLTLSGNAELDDNGYVVVLKDNKHVNATTLDTLDGNDRSGGSMVYMKNGNFYAKGVTFTKSYFASTGQGGGVIYGGQNNTYCTITVEDSIFTGLYNTGAATLYGKNNSTAHAVFTNITAHHNDGTALFIPGETGGSIVIEGGSFSSNKNSAFFGATVWSHTYYFISNVSIYNNTMSNIVTASGKGTYIVEGCSIYNNTVNDHIFSSSGSGSLTISNTTVYNNKVTAANKYMVNHTDGDLAILNSTFAGNYSEKTGFIGLKSSAANKTAVIANSIFALNKSTAADGTYTAIAQSGEGNVVKVYGSLITGPVTGTLNTAPGANLFDYENVTETAEDGTKTTVYKQVRTFTAADIFGQELADAWQSVTYKYLVDGVEKEGKKYVLAPNAGGWAAHMKNVQNLTAELSGEMFTVKAGTNTLISIASSSYAAEIADVVLVGKDAVGAARSDFFYTTIGAAAVQLKTSASMVNSTGDVKAAEIGGTNGVVTLRDAAAYAALYGWKFGESVTFDATKFESAQTITLGKDGSETFNGTITFDSAYNGKSLTIDASTTGGLTLNLNGNRGFLISAEKFTLSLTGMTITGGKVTSATANGCVSGGVIAATGENVNLIINDVIFSKNQMDAYTTQNSGAVIFVGGTGSTVNITDSEFNENGITDKGSTAMGGAIRQDSGTLTITDSVFYKNYVTTTLTGSWSSGGALYIGAVNVTLTNTDFTDNYFNLPETFTSQYAGGGAITMSDKNNSTLTIIGGTFSGNHTVGHGGAIYANTKTLKIDGTEFYNNQAYNGGAIYHTPSYRGVTIQNSIFRENKATNAGGAFYSSQAANGTDTGVVIADSVFYKNSAAYGGALYLIDKGTGSIYQIISTTMAGNTSTKMGGGIFACFNSNSQIYIANSIVLGNTYTYTEIDAASGAEVEKSIADDITFTQEASSTNHKIEARHSIIGTARHGGFGSSITDGFTASANTQKALTNVDGTSKVHAIYDIGSDGKAVLYGTADDTVSVEAVFGKNGPVFNESKQIVEVYKSDLTLSGVQTALAGRAGLYSTDGGTTWYKISDGKTYNGSDTKVILNDVAEINGVKLTGQYAYGSAEELFLNYLVVDSAADNSSADAVVTLREAVEYALKQTGKQTITFAGVTDVITLSSTLDVTGNLTIDCGTGVKVSGELTIDNGAVLTLNGTATLNSFVNNGTLNVTGNLSSTNTKFGNVTYSGTESTQTQTVLAGTYTTLTLSGSNTSKNLGGTVTANELNADSLTIAGGTLIVLAANTPAAPLSTVNNVTFSGVNASNAPLYLNSSNSVTTSAKDIYIVQNGVTASITWNLNNGEYKDSVVYDGTTYTVSASVTAGSTTKTLSFDKTAGATDADTYTYTVKDGTDYTISAEYNGTKYVTIGTNVYALDSASVTSKTFEITKREITIKANSTEKTYNGSAQTLDSYTITSELELADGQTIADGWTFDKSYTNAGTYTDIKVDDNTVKIMDDNTDVTANYDITYAAGTLKIEAQTLSGTISVGNMALLTKTYDGTKKLNTGDLKLTVTDDQGKELTLNYDSAVFNSANVSEAKKITVSGIKLTDSNYTIGDSYEITSGVFINALELDTTAIQAADGDETDTTLVGTDGKISKVYDGTTNVGPLNLTIAGATGQTLTLNHTASFAGKDVVTEGQQINLTGISIVSEGGILASNYILAETGTLDGEITKRDLTLTSESQTWVYDRSEHSCEVVNGEGFVGDEKFTYTDFAVIKDVSTIKNTFEYKDGTALVSNYNVKEEDIYYGTLEVTPKALNVADILIVDETTDSTVVTGSKGSYTITKEYDGTKTVGDLLLLIDVGTGTYLTLDYTAAFDSANVKEVQRVLLTGLAVTEDPNYTLDFTNTEITGVITAKDLTVTAKDNDTAVYNGTEQTLTGAEISGQLSGHYLADGYTFDASYTDAGTYKDIKVSESSVRIEDGDGNDMTGNYNLNFAAGTLTIGKASLSVADAVANNGDAIGKVYDGTTAVDDLTLTIGGVNGTTLTLGYGSAAYNDAGVADADSITVDGIALSADDAKNYELDADTRDYSASISKRSITITAQDAAVVYNGNAQTLTESAVTGGSLAAGQVLTGITYGQGGTNAGSYTVSISDAVITDAQGQNVSANYETAYTDGSLTIGKRAVTVQADSMKVNVSEPPSELTYQIIFGSLAAGDSFSGALKCEGSDAEQPGDYAITQGDLALTDNYILTFIDGTLTVEGGGQNADQSQTGSILNTSVLYTAVAGMTGSASAQTGLPPVFSSTEYQNGSGVGYIFATQHNQLLQTAVRPAEEGRGVLRLSSVLEQKLDRFATAGETVVKDGETAVSDHLNGDFNGQTEEDERYDLNSEDYIFSENPGLDLFTKADLFKDEIDLAIEEMMLA